MFATIPEYDSLPPAGGLMHPYGWCGYRDPAEAFDVIQLEAIIRQCDEVVAALDNTET